jgi:nucleoid-associated protein YgaU
MTRIDEWRRSCSALRGDHAEEGRRITMDLRTKYDQAIQVAKSLRMDGAATEKDGKLHFTGTVKSEDEKNQIWNALKSVPDYQREVLADIKVVPQAAAAAGAGAGAGAQATAGAGRTYTVQAGDTLSGIAKEHLGDASKYTKIFEANRDVLSDPDRIKPGQVLKIPQ